MAAAAFLPGPCAVIISCSTNRPEDIIKQILGDDQLPEPETWTDNIKAYPWHIDTKYYTADIHLCTLQSKTLGSQDFSESVQAVVIDFDSKSEESLSNVRQWFSFISHWEPEIKLLLCDSCGENSGSVISRDKLRSFCLKVSFELVERCSEPSSEDDSDEGFAEVELGGIRRIVQALQAHMWPNLELKNTFNQNSLSMLASQLQGSSISTSTDVEACSASVGQSATEGASAGLVEEDKDKKDTANLKKQTCSKIAAEVETMMDKELLEALGNEDMGGKLTFVVEITDL